MLNTILGKSCSQYCQPIAFYVNENVRKVQLYCSLNPVSLYRRERLKECENKLENPNLFNQIRFVS